MQNERVAVVESVERHFVASEPFRKDIKNAAHCESGIALEKRMLFILVGETIDHIEVDSVLLDDHVIIEAISLVKHRLRGEISHKITSSLAQFRFFSYLCSDFPNYPAFTMLLISIKSAVKIKTLL